MLGDPDSLGVCIWCGIWAVVIGAAMMFIQPWVGAIVLVLGCTWFAWSCYRHYHELERPR